MCHVRHSVDSKTGKADLQQVPYKKKKEARHGRCVLSRSLDGVKGTLP